MKALKDVSIDSFIKREITWLDVSGFMVLIASASNTHELEVPE